MKKTITAKQFMKYIEKRKEELNEKIAKYENNESMQFFYAGELVGLTNTFNILFNNLENPF